MRRWACREVQAALRKDPECLDPDLHRMEFDMMNSVYRTVRACAGGRVVFR